MSKMIPYFLLACTLWIMVAPAYAGSVSKVPLTPAENANLAAEQAQDADQVETIGGGDGVVLVLAVVGVVFLVLYLTDKL